MELETEKTSSENRKECFYSYCQTNAALKICTHVWNLHEFWTLYRASVTLKLYQADEKLPFDLIMQINKKEEKVKFHLKKYSTTRHKWLFNVYLRSSVSPNNHYTLECIFSDAEQFCSTFVVDKSFLLENQEFVTDEILRIVFTFETIEYILNNSVHTAILHCTNNKNTLNNSNFNSFKLIAFKTEETELFVNKELLCAKSGYFKKLFDGNEEEYTTIDINNTPKNIVQKFVNFIQLNDMSALKNIDIYQIFELYTMASRYEVKDLQIACEQYLKEQVLLSANVLTSKGELIDILHFAYENHIQNLLEFTINIVALNMNNYLNCPCFLYTINKHPKLVTLIKEAKINTHKVPCEFK